VCSGTFVRKNGDIRAQRAKTPFYHEVTEVHEGRASYKLKVSS